MAKPPPNLLLCFDFDGTLVNHEGEPAFHPALGDRIRELRRRGAALVINTGRGLVQTLQGLAQHNVFLTPDFVIAREHEIYRPGWFKEWTDFTSWNRRARKAHDQFVEKHTAFLEGMRHYVTTETKSEFLMGELGEIGIVAPNEPELDQISERIDAQRAQYPDVGYHRNGVYLRFSHTDYSKGTALRELGRLLKINRDRIFAAGDNHNDVSMLDPNIARFIACPGNALPPIKERVRHHGGFVAQGPASAGMIEALDHFFLRQQ